MRRRIRVAPVLAHHHRSPHPELTDIAIKKRLSVLARDAISAPPTGRPMQPCRSRSGLRQTMSQIASVIPQPTVVETGEQHDGAAAQQHTEGGWSPAASMRTHSPLQRFVRICLSLEDDRGLLRAQAQSGLKQSGEGRTFVQEQHPFAAGSSAINLSLRIAVI